MPPAKRSSTPAKASSASKPAAKKTTAAKPAGTKAAKRGAKATTTTARKSSAKTTTQAKAAESQTRKATGGEGVVATAVKSVRPRETVTLTRQRIQETLDDAASRGRVTRKDANDLVAELMRHGRQTGDEVREEVGELFGKSAKRLTKATKRVRKAEPVDRIVRGADRARRAAGVGPAFPVSGYDELNVGQVQARIKELGKPELRKVLTYERKNANRKSVVGALEKAIG